MNRLQKKCIIATVGIHLLLLIILIVGPAFYNPQPKADNTQLLNVIPANLIEAAFSSGVKNATPPAPAPVVVPPPQPTPPTPVVQPTPPPPAPKPVVAPAPTVMERVEKFFKPEPVQPAPEKAETQPHKIQVSTQLVSRAAVKNSETAVSPRLNTRVITSAIRNLQKNLNPGTTVDMPGDSSVAYADYASVVKSIYDQAWALPDSIANDDENVKVTVTIASDGTVLSSSIVTPSGDAPVDNSVQRTIDRVQFIAPFPAGTTDKQRTYIINFNPKAKRTLE
jgi:TonB family protein